MARRCETSIDAVSENSRRVYFPAELTTDSTFPFRANQNVAAIVVPHDAVVLAPSESILETTPTLTHE